MYFISPFLPFTSLYDLVTVPGGIFFLIQVSLLALIDLNFHFAYIAETSEQLQRLKIPA